MDSIATGVQVLDRAVLLVDTVAQSGPSALAELVEATGLTRPTTHRLAVALERHGLFARNADGRFVLGGRLAAWGKAASGRIVDDARPVLAALVARTGESAQLYVREGDHRVCLAVHDRLSGGLRDTVALGAVMPLTRGSGGKVLLAWATDAERFEVAAAALATVRRRGWAESVGEREAGVASVSAPVRGIGGEVAAAVSVSGPIERLGQHPGRRLARAVVEAAERLAAVIAQ